MEIICRTGIDIVTVSTPAAGGIETDLIILYLASYKFSFICYLVFSFSKVLLFFAGWFFRCTASRCFTRYVIRVVTTVGSHDGATRGISLAVMDGAGLNSRSTINRDHRLVGVDTRLTLLPLLRCTNGYLPPHRFIRKTVLKYIPCHSLPDVSQLAGKIREPSVFTNYQFHPLSNQ